MHPTIWLTAAEICRDSSIPKAKSVVQSQPTNSGYAHYYAARWKNGHGKDMLRVVGDALFLKCLLGLLGCLFLRLLSFLPGRVRLVTTSIYWLFVLVTLFSSVGWVRLVTTSSYWIFVLATLFSSVGWVRLVMTSIYWLFVLATLFSSVGWVRLVTTSIHWLFCSFIVIFPVINFSLFYLQSMNVAQYKDRWITWCSDCPDMVNCKWCVWIECQITVHNIHYLIQSIWPFKGNKNVIFNVPIKSRHF